jgi:UDP-N-acetyl-D-mannosaminuronate dehydrogenase
VVHLLQEEGAQVKVWEPFKPDANMPGVEMASSLEAALKDADAILLLVKHTQFVQFDSDEIAAKTTARIAMDCVNGWDADQWSRAGFDYFRLGDSKSQVSNR